MEALAKAIEARTSTAFNADELPCMEENLRPLQRRPETRRGSARSPDAACSWICPAYLRFIVALR